MLTEFCAASLSFFIITLGLCAYPPAILPAEEKQPAARQYPNVVLQDKPVAYWRFDWHQPNESFLSSGSGESLSAVSVGELVKDVEGPDADLYPVFTSGRRAISLAGKGHLRVSDPGKESVLDFDNGDEITLEAWVRPTKITDGQYVYIVGKGRTHNDGFADENQNYALRLAGVAGTARVSFLFRNSENRKGNEKDFHRWNSSTGFWLDDHWHHIAVTYKFGDAASMRGYLDGEQISGNWDLGGATDKRPVVDNDEIWIGSSKAGNAGNSFQGDLTEVAIYRSALSADRMKLRYLANLPPAHEQFVKDRELKDSEIHCEIIERVRYDDPWNAYGSLLTTQFTSERFALIGLPNKYSDTAVIDDRTNPFVLRIRCKSRLPAGHYQVLLRAKSLSRFFIDDKLIADLAMMERNADGHEPLPALVDPLFPGMQPLAAGHREKLVELDLDEQPHVFRFETMVGGPDLRAELGEMCVAIARTGEQLSVLSVKNASAMPLTESAWYEFSERENFRLRDLNSVLRIAADQETAYWQRRHDYAKQVIATLSPIEIPASEKSLVENNLIDRFINARLSAEKLEVADPVSDAGFLRRLALDTVGMIPTLTEIDRFTHDPSPEKRAGMIDYYLSDPRWADHWVGYWQDVLAENPGILKPKLNNTGPFRYWIYDSMLDNKPMDRFAWELVMLQGSQLNGGPSGFAVATQNDVPMAEKAHTLGKAFLALEMKCARCHDAPAHHFKQEDLFSIAAMLQRTAITLPESSTVPVSAGGRKPAIKISLKPGQEIVAHWPFKEFKSSLPDDFLRHPQDTRASLAAAITTPENERFARVIVNRLWHRMFGRGLMNPVDDWEFGEPSHPELLDFLARELVSHDYDLKYVARLILNSAAYQRALIASDEKSRRIELYAGRERRRLSAEQVVDSIYAAVGKSMDAEQLTLDPEGRRPESTFLNLGQPRRAWQYTSLSNERDRPALSLPMAQSVVDLLTAFGWRESRPSPITEREEIATVLQPLTLANGTAGHRIVQLSDNSSLTDLCVEIASVQALVDQMFQRVLSREPSSNERAIFVEELSAGFDNRVQQPVAKLESRSARRNAVSWSNHLSEEATRVKLELERLARVGDPPTRRLEADWRMRAEDVMWALINSPEFVFVP